MLTYIETDLLLKFQKDGKVYLVSGSWLLGCEAVGSEEAELDPSCSKQVSYISVCNARSDVCLVGKVLEIWTIRFPASNTKMMFQVTTVTVNLRQCILVQAFKNFKDNIWCDPRVQNRDSDFVDSNTMLQSYNAQNDRVKSVSKFDFAICYSEEAIIEPEFELICMSVYCSSVVHWKLEHEAS